jgi:acetyltransferase-like isoleucine patch superfamily enzyme
MAGNLGSLWALPWLEKTQRAGEFYWLLKSQLYYKRFFGSFGANSKLIQPMRLRNVEGMHVGHNVLINKHAFLLTLRQTPGTTPRLTIGDGTTLGHMNHITCIDRVEIGEQVLTADRVYISDHSHRFDDPRVPIKHQSVVSKGPVKIGRGSWLGENVAVLSCTIGANCVIGANAVVLSDIPDYSVAVGSPARVVRRYNASTGIWEKA